MKQEIKDGRHQESLIRKIKISRIFLNIDLNKTVISKMDITAPHLAVADENITVRTVFPHFTAKASNFGPHGNFGLFLGSSVASMDESCTKNEQNRIGRSKVFVYLLYSLFFGRTRFNDTKPAF
jgi:hypothetical protein